MDRANAAVARSEGTVVHLVGKLTEPAFGFLGPTTDVLAENGVPQTVILVTDTPHKQLLPKFNPSVRLVLAPNGSGFVRQVWFALQSLRDESNSHSISAIHLHGFLPCLLAVYAVWFSGLSPKILFSPQGSKSLWVVKGISTFLRWALWPISRRARQQTASAGLLTDASTRATAQQPIPMLEHAVDVSFFDLERRESRRPLVVTTGRANEPVTAAMFAQMAVLLGEESLALSFNWVGGVDKESRARLKAANVGVFDGDTPTDRAVKLPAAWLYVAHRGHTGFPSYLTEAMAAGLPCVAWDTPQHRLVIRDGETGFLCNSESEMLANIVRLVDSSELRQQVGSAAREEAHLRFHPTKIRDLLMEVYRREPPPSELSRA